MMMASYLQPILKHTNKHKPKNYQTQTGHHYNTHAKNREVRQTLQTFATKISFWLAMNGIKRDLCLAHGRGNLMNGRSFEMVFYSCITICARLFLFHLAQGVSNMFEKRIPRVFFAETGSGFL